PPNAARSLCPSAAANIDLPLPPEPTSAIRVGRVPRIVRASVLTSALRPFMPRGRGGKIERGDSLRTRVFGGVFDILVVPRPLHSTWCDGCAPTSVGS